MKNTVNKHFEYGHTPKELIELTDQIVSMIYNKTVKANWEKRVKSGLAFAEAEDAIERFTTGVNEAIELAEKLLKGKEYEYWNYKEYKKKMEKTHQVVSAGQFALVGGAYGIESAGGAGPTKYVGHEDLFPNGEGRLIDALTNATVDGLGTNFPDQIDIANTINRLVGGTQCSPYHYAPLLEKASSALLSVMPIGKKGAKVIWLNAGGGSISVGLKISERFIANKKGLKRRKPVFFTDAYHGNNEGRAGSITSGINDNYDKEDKGMELPFPSDRVTGKKVMEELKKFAMQDQISCVVFEPTQGDGGGNSFNPETFIELVKFSLTNNVPLIVDEVQSGFGRSGKYFDIEYLLDSWKSDIEVKSGRYPSNVPLIMVVAKSMTNGAVPGSAVIFSKEYDVLGRAEALNTYSAHPMTLAATIATVKYMTPEFLKEIKHKREVFDKSISEYINSKKNPNSILKRVKGHGGHIFVEIDSPRNLQLLQIMLLGRKRILTGTVAKNGLRVHLPNNAPDVVYRAVAQSIGEIAKKIEKNEIDHEAIEILKSGPSGLAERTVQENPKTIKN